MEKDQKVRSQFRGGSSAIVANNTDKPNVIAAKLQALSPKYNSVMNHIRIHLPEMFPSLDKVVFLDDDIVVQTDLSPLWDIDMNGKVSGAVETCRGEDNFVMSKRLKKLEIRPEPVAARNITPGLIAFHGHVHVIDPFWHMLGLGYQENTSSADVKSAGVIHFNGRAKPWLEIAFPKLRPFWAKYVDFSDKFIKSCHIRAS
ncbi:hypothetical protein GBA52_014016 [Prunus armeniaca]|nr:hypothetical protein GBA52_014016 [Prunus armeniaca]